MFLDLTLAIAIDDPVVARASDDQKSYMSRGHIGTHLDTYLQTPIPPAYVIRRGLVFDIRACGDTPAGIEVLAGRTVAAGDFVMFRSGRLEATGYGSGAYFRDHPQLSWALFDHLLAAGVSFIGIDAAGVRRGEEHATADERAEAAGCYIIENIANLGALVEAVGARPFRVHTGWTGLTGFSGLACRVVAEVD